MNPVSSILRSLGVFAVASAVVGIAACCRDARSIPVATLGAPETAEYGGAVQRLEDRGSHVYCRVEGRGTVFGGVGGMKDVFRYARENDRKRVLLDIREADVAQLSTPEVIVGTLALLPFWDFGTRISVLMPAETLPGLVDRYSFPAGRIRLIKLRRFDKMEDAQTWLLEDASPAAPTEGIGRVGG